VADRDRLDVTPEDHEIVTGVRVVHAPGHTRGHRAIRIASAGEELLVTGDAVHHPFQVSHPDWPSTHDHDPATGVETRNELLRSSLADDPWVCVPHFGEPFGRVVASEGRTRWAAGPMRSGGGSG
jgi:glyoxylase-like metal-dependent hydrolase (beta-lactamase superfamily II)